MKLLIVPLCLVMMIVVSSCNSSPLSNGELTDLALIGAKIEIYQNLSDKNDNSITVSLYDGDNNTVDNKNIGIRVNGFFLDTVETHGLYYTKSNFYAVNNVSVDDAFNFEIIMTDKKAYALGSVKTIAESSADNITLPTQGDFEKDLNITWHGLNEVNQLSISRSVLLKTSTELEKTYPYEPEIIKKIGADGAYSISKSSFITSKHILSGVELKFKAQKFGEINHRLSAGSEIKIYGQIEKYVDFDEEKQFAK